MVHTNKYMHYPIYIDEMVDIANDVYECKSALRQYYCLLDCGKEKTEAYFLLTDIVNIIEETKTEIQSFESDWYNKMKTYEGFLLFMRNIELHKRLEGIVTSMKHRQENIKKMYIRAKEKIR